MRLRTQLSAVALISLLAASCSSKTDQEQQAGSPPVGFEQANTNQSGDTLRVAVLTGGHEFDVPHFSPLFRQLPGIDAYPQHIYHFASSPEEIRDSYDAVVFYGMGQGMPEEEGRRAAGNPRAAIDRVVAQGQGIVILHHALLAWEEWDLWNQLIGFENRNFRYKEGLKLNVQVADDQHPICQGISDFEIADEGYVLHGDYDGQGPILLTVDHENAMPQVAWAREHDNCRVFCLALGHDNLSWTNPAFRNVLSNGITWTAGDDSAQAP